MESALSNKSSSYKNSLTAITASESRFFSALPSNIRSPQLAIESWRAEADALRMKKEQARDEVNALREGVIDWEEAVVLISNFEKNLRRQMNPGGKPAGTSGSKSMQLGKTSKTRKDNQSLFGMSSMVSSQNPHGDPHPSRSTYLNKNKSQIISSSSPTSGSASVMQLGQGQGNSKRNSGLKRFDSLLNESDHEDGSVPEHLFSRAPSGFLPPRPQDQQQQAHLPESLEQKILLAIEDVLEKLEDKVANAESKSWNLLVCCLAAEAQAFREAREIILRRLAEMDEQDRMKKEEAGHTQGLLSDNDDMELKSKFGRMEIGKGKQQGGGGGGVGTGIDYGNMAGFEDGHTPNWDSTTHDFDTGLDAILEDNKPEFFSTNLDASSGQGGHTTSSSISPKTPSRRNSTSGRSRNVRKIKHDTSIDEDGNEWDREDGGFDGGIDEDDSNTIRGASSMQFLKGPTVGQVMRGQGTSASVTHAPSGISIGLGTWGRLKKAGMSEHIHSGASSGWDSDPGVRGSSGAGGGGGETRSTAGGNDGDENLIIG